MREREGEEGKGETRSARPPPLPRAYVAANITMSCTALCGREEGARSYNRCCFDDIETVISPMNHQRQRAHDSGSHALKRAFPQNDCGSFKVWF